jgi:hypothetical protein
MRKHSPPTLLLENLYEFSTTTRGGTSLNPAPDAMSLFSLGHSISGLLPLRLRTLPRFCNVLLYPFIFPFRMSVFFCYSESWLCGGVTLENT